MADIDVVPKQRSLTWLWWVIAIVVIIAALWWMFGSRPATQTGRVSQLDAPLSIAAALIEGPARV